MDGGDASRGGMSPARAGASCEILAVVRFLPAFVAHPLLSIPCARRAPLQWRGSMLATVLVEAAKQLSLIQVRVRLRVRCFAPSPRVVVIRVRVSGLDGGSGLFPRQTSSETWKGIWVVNVSSTEGLAGLIPSDCQPALVPREVLQGNAPSDSGKYAV